MRSAESHLCSGARVKMGAGALNRGMGSPRASGWVRSTSLATVVQVNTWPRWHGSQATPDVGTGKPPQSAQAQPDVRVPAGVWALQPAIPVERRWRGSTAQQAIPCPVRLQGRPASPQQQQPTLQHAPVTTASFTSPSGTDWDKIAQGESGGNWSIPSDHAGAPFRGGLQILDSTWHAFGGDKFAPTANLATPAQQKTVAESILSGQGPGAWPNTYHLGAPGKGGAPAVQPASFSDAGSWEANPGATDTASSGSPRYGAIPGAPSGMGQNIVGWVEYQVQQYNQATGSNLSITATYPGGPHGGHPDDGGDHSAFRAVDISGSPEQMTAFANYWNSRPDLVAATRQLIHQGPGFADTSNIFGGQNRSGTAIYGPGTMSEHANHDHLAMQNIPGDINPMGAPHAGTGAAPGPYNPSAAPNVAEDQPGQQSVNNSMSGLSSVLGGSGGGFRSEKLAGDFAAARTTDGRRPLQQLDPHQPAHGG